MKAHSSNAACNHARFVFIWPTQADIVSYFLHQGKVLEATLVVIVSIASVTLPLLLAQRSTNRYPEKWQPRLLTPVTWIIIVLNALLNTVLLLSQT